MNILILDTIHRVFHQRMEEAGHVLTEDLEITGDALKAKAKDFDAIVVRNRVKLERDFLEANTHLKAIGRCGSGLENIDIGLAADLGISIVNSPEGNADAVGEHVIGMLLSLFNHLGRGDHEVRQGKWRRELNRGHELGAKTVGIIGYGNTGKSLSRKLSGFGCEVLAYDPYAEVNDGMARASSFDEIKARCDVVSFHVPLTDETRHMVSDDFIRSMSNPFTLVNTSRGSVVSIEALLRGLDEGKVTGACLDVLEYEKHTMEIGELPASFHELSKKENVLLSPHVAGLTQESLVKLSSVLADKMVDLLK